MATKLYGSLVEVSVVVNGVARPIYHRASDGKAFIEGLWGSNYSIVVKNLTAHRIEIVESVDGRNVLQDEAADPVANRGMAIGPYDEWRNHGWRINDTTTNDFVFTDPGETIATQATGSTRNVGVIGVAIYREYEPPRSQYHEAITKAARPATLGPEFESTRGGDLGTGMGEARYDPVSHTTFRRATYEPGEVLEIQYRSRPWLERKGIIRPEYEDEPQAFPRYRDDETGYGKYRPRR